MSCSTAGLRVSAQHTTIRFCTHNGMSVSMTDLDGRKYKIGSVNCLSLFTVNI